MPRNIVLTVILLWSIGVAEPLVIQPVQKHQTAFAIVIDRETYELTKAAVAAYAGAIENDGLSVYTIVDQWEKPEQIRQILFDLYQKKPLLEGAVFIGDIPIPMLRDAQHLTSAFKMRQDRFEWIDTSVPSDRFYDDFDLKFNFLKQDSTQPLLFFYSLDAQSPQTVKRDIYSARIHPPVGDRPVAAVINDYLLQVAEQKKAANRLDKALVYAGHGYNSESLTAWAGDQLALREQFPHFFNYDGSIRFYYHEMSADMKAILLREIQAEDLDLVVFHAHGSEDAQLILGYPPAGAIQQNVEAIKLFVRSKLRQAQRRGQSIEEAQKYYQDSYNLPDEWFAGALDDSVTYADSVYSAQLDILVPDIRGISRRAKVLVFDECFNGAFIADSYVAGEYIFGSGNSVVGIANTVNVKQDIWLSEMIGLLNYGVRVGNWHRNFNFIESHIIGDPTYHFSGSGKTDLNRALTVEAGKLSLWKKMLRSTDVPLQVLAINRLTELSGDAFATELVDIYHASPSFTVRMSALLALANLNTPEFHSLLTESIKDPYELIRRISAVWMGEIGDAEYLPLLAEAAVRDNGKRVSFQAKNALQTLDAAAAATAVDRYQATQPGPEMAYKFDYRGALERTVANLEEDFAVIRDTTVTASKRISKIRTFRNYKYHNSLPALFELAADNSEDIAVRTVIIEALGWYHYSWQRPAIEEVCRSIVADSAVPEAVRLEAVKTLARLDQGCNNPLAP